MNVIVAIPMLLFLLVYIILNNYVIWVIPDKELRKKFKRKNEYFLTLAYLFAPLLMLQNELIFLHFSAWSFNDLQIFPFLLLVKVILFILAGRQIETLFRSLKSLNSC